MKRILGIGLMVAAMAVTSSKAEAALSFSLVLCQGNTCSTFPGNVPNGIILGSTPIGDYTVNATLAGGAEGTPTSDSALGTFTVTRNAGTVNVAPLTVWWQVQGYTEPIGPAYNFDVTMTTTQTSFGSNALRGLVSYQAWYSSNNGAFTGAPPAPTLPAGVVASNVASCTPLLSAGVDSCSSSPATVLAAPGSNLFSILSMQTINIGLGDTSKYQTTSSANLSAIPEPGSMLLLGAGLLGMAGMLRRRIAR